MLVIVSFTLEGLELAVTLGSVYNNLITSRLRDDAGVDALGDQASGDLALGQISLHCLDLSLHFGQLLLLTSKKRFLRLFGFLFFLDLPLGAAALHVHLQHVRGHALGYCSKKTN